VKKLMHNDKLITGAIKIVLMALIVLAIGMYTLIHHKSENVKPDKTLNNP